MTSYNNWCDEFGTMDDNYDTLEKIILPIISNVLGEDLNLNKANIKENIQDYCVDDWLNLNL